MAKRIMHVSLSARGALNDLRGWINCITVDGKLLTTEEEVKAFLESELEQGHELLPMADCEGHDWKTGCPGHAVDE